jgi:hypothetical protein
MFAHVIVCFCCRLLASTYLAEDYFDFVDVDSFGSDSSHLAAALQAVKYSGMIYLTSTDGFCSGGERHVHGSWFNRPGCSGCCRGESMLMHEAA